MTGDNTSTIIARSGTPLFSPDQRFPGSVNLICGRRNTGKSTLLNDLLHVDACYSEVLVFEPFWPDRERLPGFITMEHVRDKYDDDAVRELQKNAVTALVEGRDERRLLVLANHHYERRPYDALFGLCCRSRALKIDVYIVTSDMASVPPNIRMNADYAFFLPEHSPEKRDCYHREFFHGVCSSQQLHTLFDAHAGNFGAIVRCRRTEVMVYRACMGLAKRPLPVVEDKTHFKPETRTPGSVHLVVGARRTGKKTLLKHLLGAVPEAYQRIRTVAPFWSGQAEGTVIGVDGIVVFLEEAIAAQGCERRALVLLDSFNSDAKEMAKSDAFFELCCSSHRLGVDVYIVVQDVRAVAPRIRSNVDYVFAMGKCQRDALRNLHREYFDRLCPKLGDFEMLVERRTDNYGAVVLDRQGSAILHYRMPACE